MPFCRHCGDLVLKDRCGKCGGTPVAASFSWNKGQQKSESPDRWKQTYTMERPVKRTESTNATESKPTRETASAAGPSTPVRRFPRPQSTTMSNRISEHISATTSERTPTNKHNKTASLAETLNSSPSGNPVLDDGVALSKVYGSVLQSPESLKSYACANCNAIFTRDATLYPDPEQPTRMLCRPCFLDSSGTTGYCAACSKSVTRLKQEGQFVENSGKVWHKKCFLCNGCGKNIAAKPSVDLFGRPCCPDCFDTSLHRPLGSKTPSPAKIDTTGNSVFTSNDGSNPGSPVISELNRRLGIQSKEGSPTRLPQPLTPKAGDRRSFIDLSSPAPATEDLSKRLRATTLDSATLRQTTLEKNRDLPSGWDNPIRPRLSNPSNSPRASLAVRPVSQALRTPDLTEDASDGADSACTSPQTPKADPSLNGDEEDALCDGCKKPLFSVAGGGRVVTVPPESGHSGRFHSVCFVCAECGNPFIEKAGAATFVVSEKGLTHLHCAPLPKPTIVTRQRPVSVVPLPRPEPPMSAPATRSTHRPASSLSNYAPRPASSLSNSSGTSPVIGGFNIPNKNRCAGCDGMVAIMEPGVVPGPNGSRWHASCLVCGGKGRRRNDGEPGCGKRLDRDAKLDPEGKTWCSNCMTLLILNGSISSGPLRTPVSATMTGGSTWVSSQSTGSSSVTVHSTGSSTSTLTGSNTSSLTMLNRRSGAASPTKGMFGGAVPVNRTLSNRRPVRPRPKSVSVLPNFSSGGVGARVNLAQETGQSIRD